MSNLLLNDAALPGLFQSADKASIKAQSSYYFWLRTYLILLVFAALASFLWPDNVLGAITSATLFMITLIILIMLRFNRSVDTWYNGRAVAESVKTRSWRWVMRAEPYTDHRTDIVIQQFIQDFREILAQNESLSRSLAPESEIKSPVSETMQKIRALPVVERLYLYKTQRIDDQSRWYANKARTNKNYASFWLWFSVALHAVAVLLLLVRVSDPTISLPIEVLATAAGATLSWLESKKYNELTSSYALAAHEISLIQGAATTIKTEGELADFVLNSEYAFSREHTQYVARKS